MARGLYLFDGLRVRRICERMEYDAPFDAVADYYPGLTVTDEAAAMINRGAHDVTLITTVLMELADRYPPNDRARKRLNPPGTRF